MHRFTTLLCVAVSIFLFWGLPGASASDPPPDTAISNISCGLPGTGPADCNGVDNDDGGETVSVTFTVTNGNAAECKQDAGAWFACSSPTHCAGGSCLWVEADCVTHTVYVRGKRTSGGAVDTSPASKTVYIKPSTGCPPPLRLHPRHRCLCLPPTPRCPRSAERRSRARR
jgi:hypothetical protein